MPSFFPFFAALPPGVNAGEPIKEGNMRKGLMFLMLAAMAMLLCFAVTPAEAQRKTFLAFGGGPTGGTFNYFANGIAIYLSRAMTNVGISSLKPRGSMRCSGVDVAAQSLAMFPVLGGISGC